MNMTSIFQSGPSYRTCLCLLPLLMAFSCSSGGTPVSTSPSRPADIAAPSFPDSLQSVAVAVPATMRQDPFDRPRRLNVPTGFSISVFARLPEARFMAVAPNGDLLVTSPGNGKVTLFRPDGKAAGRQFTFAFGLHNPHDIAFHVLRGETYIYIAESNRIIRAPYTDGETRIGVLETVVADLPDSSSPELKGRYGHQLKNIALHGEKLYVAIASTCNACIADTVSDPIRNAIYEYDADNGGNRRLVARGLRNAEGVRFKPGTDELWAVVNNRDNIAYPYENDWDGDGVNDYGKVMQSYVDKHPPDLLVKVKDGGNYGWPFCNSNPDHGRDNMPYDRDVQLNADGSRLDCGSIDRVTRGLDPHSAPLGMNFLQNAGLPEPYSDALVVALHGCWNCSAYNGHKVVVYPFRKDGSLGGELTMVSGWIIDPAEKKRWGRPVTAVPDGKGGLYISDDYSGTIYLLSASRPPPTENTAIPR